MSSVPLVRLSVSTLPYGSKNNTYGAKTGETRDAATDSSSGKGGGGLDLSGAQLSLPARIAFAERADNAKSSSDLTDNLRAEFDAQYTAAGTVGSKAHAVADVSELSSPGLAAVILNQGGCFSKQEVQTARSELDGRARSDLESAIGAGASKRGGHRHVQQERG